MNILILFKRWKGGVGTVVKNIKRELEKRKHKVDVISRDDCNIKGRDLRKFVIKHGNKYDIIFTQDWSLALPLLFPYPIFIKKHYCLFHGHQPNKLRFLQTLIGKWMGNKLCVVGDTLKKRFPKSNLIYNGVDTKRFYDLNLKRKCLGWIERDYEVIDKQGIINLAKKLNLIPFIAKDIPYECMNSFYNQCEVFVSLPRDYTGFNLCWLEAMASGVPKIVHNQNGIGSKIGDLNVKDLTWKKSTEKLLEVLK